MMRIENSTVYTENYQNRRRFREAFEERGGSGGDWWAGKKRIGVYIPCCPSYIRAFCAPSVLSYIFSPPWLEKCFYISHASLVGFV